MHRNCTTESTQQEKKLLLKGKKLNKRKKIFTKVHSLKNLCCWFYHFLTLMLTQYQCAYNIIFVQKVKKMLP